MRAEGSLLSRLIRRDGVPERRWVGPLAAILAVFGILAIGVVAVPTSGAIATGPSAFGVLDAHSTWKRAEPRTQHRCRVSGSRDVSQAFGPALGPGPVYPITGSTLIFEFPASGTSPFAGTGWGATRILWVAPRRYRGRIVIRGRQLDGSHGVRFSLADGKILDQLDFKPGSSLARSRGAEQWRQFPTYTLLQASGCYAFTVIGSSFTKQIVFRAQARTS